MRKRVTFPLLFLCIVLFCLPIAAFGETVARCGQGWLETIDGYPVLHLKGTPYEMGFQHGALLKQSIRENLHNVLESKRVSAIEVGGVTVNPRWVIDTLTIVQSPFVPDWYQEELKG